MLCVYVLLNNVIPKQFQPNYGVWDGLLLKRGTESNVIYHVLDRFFNHAKNDIIYAIFIFFQD